MRSRTLLLVGLLLLAPLTGCLGGEDTSDAKLQEQRAEVTAETGGIEGVVTDEAVQPVPGATVELIEVAQTTTAAEDGSYAFSNVQPGTYTVVFRADGFLTAKQEIEVSAGEVSTVDVILTHLVEDTPYVEKQELNGFIECGSAWSVEPLRGTVPYATASLAACYVPNEVLGIVGIENTTNDRFLHYHQLEPPVESMVYEMTWDSQASALLSVIEIEAFPNDNDALIWVGGGSPPIYQVVDKPVFQRVAKNFTDLCENGTDAYCGYNFWDKGWPLQLRVFAHWDCNDQPVRACPITQERFTHFVSTFYNEPAPQGYAILDENPT